VSYSDAAIVFGSDAVAGLPTLGNSLSLGLGTGGDGVGVGFVKALSDAAKPTQSSTSTKAQSTERLSIVRPRSADLNERGREGRGQFAYIKLLTNPELKAAYASGDLTKRDVGVGADGKKLFQMATNMVDGYGYDKFLLTSVSGSFNEKVQVKEVFGDSEVAYFFGRQPVMLNLGGTLIDSPDNQWFTDWLQMYSEFFRGTQLAKNYELLQLVLPNMIVTGSVTGMTWTQAADRDTDIAFTMQFLVKSLAPKPILGQNMISSNEIQTVNFPKAGISLTKAGMNVLKASVAAEHLSAVLSDPTLSLGTKALAVSSAGTSLQDISSKLDSATSAVNGVAKDLLHSPILQGVNTFLTGVRSSLFSPVYGVLGSLTKLITAVFAGTRRIFDGYSAPVLNILRDINALTAKARGVESLLSRSATGLGRIINSRLSDISSEYKTVIGSMGKSRGTIVIRPHTALQTSAILRTSGGSRAVPAFLQANGKGSFSTAVLRAGQPVSTKLAILKAFSGTLSTSHIASLDV
jgi:hypothetical protein